MDDELTALLADLPVPDGGAADAVRERAARVLRPAGALARLGEMGIGNTTPAAAVSAAVFGGPAEEWTGRGTGIDEATWAAKVAVVEDARRRLPADCSPMEALRQVGGPELVALAGAVVEARRR